MRIIIVPMSTHAKTHAVMAAEHIEIAQIYKATMDDIVGGLTELTKPGKIAEANRGIGLALKLAEIHSNLAIAEAISASFPALPINEQTFTVHNVDAQEVADRIREQVEHYTRAGGETA